MASLIGILVYRKLSQFEETEQPVVQDDEETKR